MWDDAGSSFTQNVTPTPYVLRKTTPGVVLACAAPSPRATAASPPSGDATGSDRRAACRRSGTSGSSSPRWPRSGCAESASRTTRHGLPNRPCAAMPSRNAVTFSGNASPGLGDERVPPARQHVDRCLMQPRDRLAIEPARQQHRRQPRRVEDLVRVRVADAAQQPRVGQRPLERVILARQRCAEFVDGRRQHVDAAGIERGQCRATSSPGASTPAASRPLR